MQNPLLSRAWAMAALTAGFSLIFALDWTTGTAPMQHLYYLPIVLSAVTFGGQGGVLAAVLAIVCYHAANALGIDLRYRESDVLQMAVFVAVGMVADKLVNDARRMHQLAMTDDLTGLHNLRSFEVHLRNMVRNARQANTPVSLLVLDLDRLKSLNDVHGHLAGAEAVRSVGRVLAARLPPTSVACRYGGDEFVVALPLHSRRQAARVAEDLREAVEAVAPMLAGVAFPAATLSISVGVASLRFDSHAGDVSSADDDSVGEVLFRAADAALYDAKRNGRNRVAAVEAPMEQTG